MLNTAVAIKFPQADLKEMDQLVSIGEYISRSDLIREGTRKLIDEEKRENMDKTRYVKAMEKEGVFKNQEMLLLTRVFLGKDIREKDKRIIKKLSKDPLKPIEKVKGDVVLTDIGKDLATAFLESKLHLANVI